MVIWDAWRGGMVEIEIEGNVHVWFIECNFGFGLGSGKYWGGSQTRRSSLEQFHQLLLTR